MSRKEAIREYKERKIPKGVYAVRCRPTGALWIGASPNLGAARNSAWFQLRAGAHRDKALQEEWNAHGEEAFEFEVVETLADDTAEIGVRDALGEKKRKWAAARGGRMLL